MAIVVVGENHKSAPLAVRERLAFTESQIRESITALKAMDGVEECIILSTCNRVEVIANSDHDRGIYSIQKFLCDYHGLSPEDFKKYSYRYVGKEAINHIFKVTSSLDSMIVGEPQILGQVKSAYSLAKELNATGIILDKLFQKAFSIAKRVRSETGIAKSAVSVGYAAVELAKKIFGDLTGKSIMILGAGEMSELAATHLVRNGITAVFVSNRTFQRAVELAEMFNGIAINYDEFLTYMEKVDIVISSTAAPHYIIKKEDAYRIIKLRRGRPLFIIDIAVPRDVDPGVNEVDNIYLYDIDNLQEVVNGNIEERKNQAEIAEKILAEETKAFEKWLSVLAVTPTIAQLKNKLYKIGREELERFSGKLGASSPEQIQRLEHLVFSIINKILHAPLSNLKISANSENAVDLIDRYEKIFGLANEEGDKSRQNGEARHGK
ncbi:MAG: glutamyl-tRNA reductase [Acidobacteriota bacterium]